MGKVLIWYIIGVLSSIKGIIDTNEERYSERFITLGDLGCSFALGIFGGIIFLIITIDFIRDKVNWDKIIWEEKGESEG